MHPWVLPLADADMPSELSRPLASGGHSPSITVVSAEFRPPKLRLRLIDPHGQPWRWILTMDDYDFMEDGVSANAQAFVVTIRANLEEWWHTKDLEPLPSGLEVTPIT